MGFCTVGAGGGVGFLGSGADLAAALATGAGLLGLTALLTSDLSAKDFVAGFFCAGEGVGFADLEGFTGLRFLTGFAGGVGLARDADLAEAVLLGDLAGLAAVGRAMGLADLAGVTRAADLGLVTGLAGGVLAAGLADFCGLTAGNFFCGVEGF